MATTNDEDIAGAAKAADGIMGKKIFFLYPPSVMKEELLMILVRHEYEIYPIESGADALTALRLFPGSILFANIDRGMKEEKWDKFIRQIMADHQTAGAGVGILSYENDPETRAKYLIEIGIQCGYIRLNIGVKESADIILKALQANEAKGRRKYIRAKCRSRAHASFNARMRGRLYPGTVIDISSVGMACRFDEDPDIEKNTMLDDIQLALKGAIIKLGGIYIGSHEVDQQTDIILFDPKLSNPSRDRIRNFVYCTLNEDMQGAIRTGHT